MTLYFYKKVDTVLHQTECRIDALPTDGATTGRSVPWTDCH